ncbi:ABC-type nitrate/sulfonate/bicarbonate transport system permease component [Bradyrhizobium sp. LB1.3]
MSRVTLLALQILVAIVCLVLWQLLTTVPVFGKILLPPFFFSNPVDVFAQIVKWFSSGVIWRHLGITLTESILAFVIGSAGGVLVGFWFARQPLVAAVFDPYVKMVNALPRVVLAPIFALWLGLGIWSKVALGVTLVFFIVFFNVYQGVKEVSRTVLDNGSHARHERAAVDAARLLAVGAVVDVLVAAHFGGLRRGRRGRRRISGIGGGARLSDPAG